MVGVLSDKRVTAGKRHTCDHCGKIIEIGEEYRYSKLVYDGLLYGWHACDRCRDYVAECFARIVLKR